MSKILEETTGLEQKNEASAEAGHDPVKPDTYPEEAMPTLKYEEIPEPKTKSATTLHVKLVRKKSRKVGLIALAALVVAGLTTTAAYSLGVFGGAEGAALRLENKTEPPGDAVIPVFSPIDPADFSAAADENFVIVPDETGLELPAFGHGPQISAEPKNHHTQTPNVSAYFTRAAQDESFVYFLQGPPSGKYGLYNLARANISTGKAESVPNANEVSGSIYSFTLHGQNIITCEHRAADDSFAFYRVPKSGEDAQLLFETASPAYMNVFDNKIFMLFVEEQALGVFDPASDTQPAYISLELLGDTAHYFPQFSVVNGYLYYGVWYDNGPDSNDDEDDGEDPDKQGGMEYMRRSLYTGETVTLLSCESGDAIWNPCWDEDGNAYYAQYDSGSMEFSLVALKDSGKPQIISEFDHDGIWPLIAFKDEFLVAALPPDSLCQYERGDFTVKLEASAESRPLAATKDFLIVDDGMYRLFDFEFMPSDTIVNAP